MAFTINGEEVYPIGYYTPTGERRQPTVSDGEVDLTIDLSGVVNPVVTYYRDTGKTNIENVINRPVGYRSAYHPEDIVPFLNTMTIGGLNNLSPTLWLRRGYDTGKLLNGNMNWTDYTNSWINGNNGIFTDLQAAAHPIWAAIGNGAADILTLGGAGLLKSTAGQYRAGQAATLAFNNGTWDYIVGATSPNTGLRATLAESPWVSENFLTVIKPQVRTKVGDVEIDNPGLYYHQSGAGKALNFVSTGRMRTPTEEYWLAKEEAGERIPLLLRSGVKPGYPQSPGQTMFSQGGLWYGITPNNNPDLLVTAKEMPIANKNASVMTDKASLRVLEDQGSRRVTSDNIYEQGPHNRQNTSAYTWEPGYGYRRVSSEKTPTIIEWTDAARVPQK